MTGWRDLRRGAQMVDRRLRGKRQLCTMPRGNCWAIRTAR